MFNPESTITVSGWMLQTVNKGKSKQRAQALTAHGNEHAHAFHSERDTESAEFTLGGTYTGNMTVPNLESGITDFTVTYTETEYPKLSVNKDSAAGGGTFTLPFKLPARAIGVPSTIADVYTAIGSVACKQLTIAVSCQHVEETDGNGSYDPTKLSGMRDATVAVTFTGVNGKPSPTMATGWESPSDTATQSNTAVDGGTIVYEKHFPIGTDDDAANNPASAS